MASKTLYVFGDQSLDILPTIRHLTKQSRRNPPLRDFMRTATDSIQHAILTIPAHLRPNTSSFDSPLQLAEAIGGEAKSTPLVSSLLAIAHFGDFIVHLSSHPRALDGSQSLPTFLGLCTGSLAAAAIASCRSLTELLRIAPHIVSLSFHVGLSAYTRSRTLESSDESWATVFRDVNAADLQDILDEFNSNLADHSHKRAYISAVGESSVTVSAPPSILEKLISGTTSLKKARTVKLPIKAGFHARHLIPIPHTRILQHLDLQKFRRQLQHLVISPCSGRPYLSSHLEDTLHHIIDEILQQPIDWCTTGKGLPHVLASDVTVITIGPFMATSAFSRWLPCHQQQSQTDLNNTNLDDTHSREGSGAIAITGMSLRGPGSETLEEFWNVLQNGRDLHKEIPHDRFDIHTQCDPTGKTRNTTLTPYGVFIDRPGYFDPLFFNMSPREALQTDPQQRLMLLTAYEALENAGYSPNRTPASNTRRIASFIGQTGDDYREFNANQDVDTYFITGNIRAFGPGRINYHFGWEGPSLSVDTACSSSGASIQLACSALLSRECDTAISGGANLLTSPDLFAGLSRGGFLSKTGGCKTFDQDADGYARGEACGVIVLKRLEDALTDRDNILAVIRGAKTNHSAEAVSITHPHEKTQERLFKAVLNDAGVLPHEVDLAEIHGTGTQAGDAIESRSVTNVLCQGRSTENPLRLSTVKPNVGHSEAASGVTSVIKAILMLQKHMIPPHIGVKGLMNKKLPPFEELNVQVCSEPTSFLPRAQGDGKRRILVNNFDAAGGNTSMLLEDPPQLSFTGQDPRSHKVVAFSAKSKTALANNIRNVLAWVKEHPEESIENLAYTTTSRRIHHPFRKAVAASSMKELATLLDKSNLDESVRRSPGKPSTVFCFTGQGSQYISMASTLYETHPTFREHIDEYASICASHDFPPFLQVIQGDATALDCTIRTQLSIVAIELALASLWRSWGIKASAVIGHSLGEYAALCYAGVISPSDCLYLVGKRAELIARKCTPDTHLMLAVQACSQIVREHMQDLPIRETEFACYNSPKSTVLSGPLAEIEYLNDFLKSEGLVTRLLPARHAFHSSQLDTILDDFEGIARGVTYTKAKIPVASTLFGRVVTHDNVFGSRYLKSQTRNSVKFQDAVESLYSAAIAHEATVWIEVGPNPTCLSMVKATYPGARSTVPSLQKTRNDWQVLSSSVCSAYDAGLGVDWVEFNRPFEQSLKLLQIPNYSFDLKNYWIYTENDAKPKKVQTAENVKTLDAKRGLFVPTTGLHTIENLEINTSAITATFVSKVSSPSLNKVLRGHTVNGVALCPSSAYADMALAAACYIRDISETDAEVSLEVNEMQVNKPLIIASGETSQMIRVSATKSPHSSNVAITFSSQDEESSQDHATCVVRYADIEESAVACRKSSYLIRTRIDHLDQASSRGKIHSILRPMVYKLFKNFVDYQQDYQGLEQVLLDTDMLEAGANVQFRVDSGGFVCSPYWIDSIAHLAGFILNGTEFTPEDSVYISHGWKSLKILDGLTNDKRYQSYVRMQPSNRRNVLVGDVHLFDDEKLVAVCQDLQFQKVRRSALEYILPDPRRTQSSIQHHAQPSPPRSSIDKIQSSASINDSSSRSPSATGRIGQSVEQILELIANELGCQVSDLEEDVELYNLGVDSLMATSILTTLATELDTHLPASVFLECRTVRELRACLTVDSIQERSHKDKALEVKDVTENKHLPYFSDILQILAEELRLDVCDLEDNTVFADIGVDSLLSVGILPRLNQITGTQFPASLFIEYPTVRDLREYLQTVLRPKPSLPMLPALARCRSMIEEDAVGLNTPATECSEIDDECCLANRSITTEVVRKIVAEEVGLSTQEVADDTLLVELGVDSLLSLSILTRVKEQTGMVLASNFLFENPTFSAIERALTNTTMAQLAATPPTRSGTPLRSLTPLPPCKPVATHTAFQQLDTRRPIATSILLQNSFDHDEPCLFLIPDGSGSSSSYVSLPNIGHTGAVYGLNSPFLANPDSFKMSLHDLVTLYIAEIIRIQPTGPYYIGGWSVGGICAFEAASQLIRRYGQKVSSLILIDAPCPTVLPPLPIEDVDFLQSIGTFDALRPRSKFEGGAPVTSTALGLRNGVREHFAGTLNALEQYSATPIEDLKCPETVLLLWARHGVWESLGEEMKLFAAVPTDNKHPTTSWLMDSRPRYGTCGWEELLPGSNFTCDTVQGDHFSMMRKPGILEMGAKISPLFDRASG